MRISYLIFSLFILFAVCNGDPSSGSTSINISPSQQANYLGELICCVPSWNGIIGSVSGDNSIATRWTLSNNIPAGATITSAVYWINQFNEQGSFNLQTSSCNGGWSSGQYNYGSRPSDISLLVSSPITGSANIGTDITAEAVRTFGLNIDLNIQQEGSVRNSNNNDYLQMYTLFNSGGGTNPYLTVGYSWTCSSPCQNGGNCVGPNTCQCINGYSGSVCQTSPSTGTTQNPTTGTTKNPTTGTTQNPTTGTTKNPTTGTTQNPTTGTTQNPTTGTTATTGTTGTTGSTGSTGTTNVPCIQGGTFRTQSDGDWGDKCNQGFATGCYRDDNFAKCFPNGLTVGCTCQKKNPEPCYNMQFNSSTSISNYLPQLGAPGSLDSDYINPSNPPPISTTSGTFGGQVTALALSIGFSSCDPTFHTDCLPLPNLFVCDHRCECRKKNNCKRNSGGCQNLRYAEDDSVIISRNNVNTPDGKPIYPNCEQYYGWTIGAIFEKASNVLGQCDPSCPPGNSDPTCDQSHLNSCLTFINQAFVFGKTLDDVASGTLFKENSC